MPVESRFCENNDNIKTKTKLITVGTDAFLREDKMLLINKYETQHPWKANYYDKVRRKTQKMFPVLDGLLFQLIWK